MTKLQELKRQDKLFHHIQELKNRYDLLASEYDELIDKHTLLIKEDAKVVTQVRVLNEQLRISNDDRENLANKLSKIADLKEELETKDQLINALENRNQQLQGNLVLAQRLLRIIKATVNGIVFEGEDKSKSNEDVILNKVVSWVAENNHWKKVND